jgi:molybdenum cofactor cytidylyltransferase
MRSGLASLPDNVDSTVFLLCDQPHISPLLIRSLIERRAETRAPIVAPTTGGKRGNPVLFGRETFEALMTVTGDRGGRAVFNQFNVEWLPWVDSRIALDVDQPGDEEILYRAYFGFE